MVVLGLGAGLSFASVMTLAMSGATPQDAGLASGLVNTSVQVGGAIGLAVLATLAAQRSDTLQAAGHATDAALNGGYHLAYVVGAALLGVGLLVAAIVVRSPQQAPATAGEAEPVLAHVG
jgi:MFS family permease